MEADSIVGVGELLAKGLQAGWMLVSLAHSLHSASDGRKGHIICCYSSRVLVVLDHRLGWFLLSFLPQVACRAWLFGTDWFLDPFSFHQTTGRISSICH